MGVHLNVSQGPPLSPEGRELAGPTGVMNFTAMQVILKAAFAHGWSRRCSRSSPLRSNGLDHGIRPTHLDSHRHVHAFKPVNEGVLALARHYNVPFVRRHREVLPGGGWPKPPAKQRRISRILNWLGRLAGPDGRATLGTWGVRHTGMIGRELLVLMARRLPAGVTEIMTHPGLGAGLDTSATRLLKVREDELAALCDLAVREAFDANKVKRIHYGNLSELRN